MNAPLITCLTFISTYPLVADIAVDTSAPKLPPPPSGETVTLNPEVIGRLTKEIGGVLQLPGQTPNQAAQAGGERSAPPLSPLPGEQPGNAAVSLPAPASPVPAAAAATPQPSASTAPASSAVSQPLLPAYPANESLARWQDAMEAYGSDAMPVRLLALLQSLNPQKPLAQNEEAYTEALACHRLALSGNAAAMRQLARAFESGSLAGLVFPQSMVASYFFMNKAQSSLPDLKPSPANP